MQTDATKMSREERHAVLEQRHSAVAHQLRRLAIELTVLDRQFDDIEQPEGEARPMIAAWTPESTTAIAHLRDVLWRPELRIARPQGRSDDRRRDGDVRIRPNRPGPSRTQEAPHQDVLVNWSRRRGRGLAPPRSPSG
jgi:hypothetical protein